MIQMRKFPLLDRLRIQSMRYALFLLVYYNGEGERLTAVDKWKTLLNTSREIVFGDEITLGENIGENSYVIPTPPTRRENFSRAFHATFL